MYGEFGRTQDGQDYWIGYGRDAVSMARVCAARCRSERMWEMARRWDVWAAQCNADPTKPLRCNLPPGVVTYERHSRGIFGPHSDRMFDER